MADFMECESCGVRSQGRLCSYCVTLAEPVADVGFLPGNPDGSVTLDVSARYEEDDPAQTSVFSRHGLPEIGTVVRYDDGATVWLGEVTKVEHVTDKGAEGNYTSMQVGNYRVEPAEETVKHLRRQLASQAERFRQVLRVHELSEAQGEMFCPSCDRGGLSFPGHAPGCAWVEAMGGAEGVDDG